MISLTAGAGALDYLPCRYGRSRLVFRGPERDLSRPYVAMLGGTPTFGKYVARPYPDLVEQAIGHPVVNLGGLNAGPDFYLSDHAALDIAAGAKIAVVQITGAEVLSNPFYSVHGRRNDRFLAATPALRDLYPDVDFADIHYTRHLLQVLSRADPGRFQTVRQTLRETWLAKMRLLLSRLSGRSLLLWLASSAPPARAEDLQDDPLFIDRALLDALRPDVAALVEVVPSPRARVMGLLDKTFDETEAAQAACLPGSAAHAEVAAGLRPVIQQLW